MFGENHVGEKGKNDAHARQKVVQMYLSQDPIGLLGGTVLYVYVHDTNLWVDIFGWAKTYAQKKAWKDAREAYWKKEAKKKGAKYSQHNLDRMKKGLAPQIKVEVENNKTNKKAIKVVLIELHHKKAQHLGGSNKSSNTKYNIMQSNSLKI